MFDPAPQRTRPRSTLIAVAVVAVVVNTLALIASQIWVCPDSSYYINLAGGIADRLDFTNELFLIRPPGYPLILAGIFALFGQNSPTAILIVQHAMLVGIAAVTALIAWHLTERRSVTLIAGLMAAGSLQLLAFANVIITEVPYTLAVLLSVYFLVKYHRRGHRRDIALASLTTGVAYLIRPVAMSAVALCVLAVIHRAWKNRGKRTAIDPPEPRAVPLYAKRQGSARADLPLPAWGCLPDAPGTGRNPVLLAAATLALAVIPAMAVVAPVMTLNRFVHGVDLTGPCSNLALYHRVFAMDRLDSTNSEALRDIRTVVREAIDQGHLPSHADHRQWGVVWKAYETVRNIPVAESSGIMRQAARDVIRENRRLILENTVRYTWWMLMVPDTFYRFQPGGARGTVAATGECIRDPDAEIFDIATYEPMMRQWMEPYERYLPLSTEPRAATPVWSGIARWFYRHVDHGSPHLGLGDSLYEEFTWLCLLGVVVSLATRNRMTWLLVAGVIALQVVPSAALGGPTPRYAVPIKPLMLLFAALSIVMILRAATVPFRLRRRVPPVALRRAGRGTRPAT